MITITIISFCVIVALLFAKANYKEGKMPLNKIIISASIVIIGLIAAFVNPITVERVDAGHVGIKVNLTGDSRGISKFEYKTGWVVLNSWVSKLYEFPTFQQSVEYANQNVITKGGFNAVIHPKFNYSLKPGDVGDMFQNLRLPIDQIEQGWLYNAIVGAMNDVTNKWAVDDIFNHREQFENDIVIEANKRVSKWFIISQLRTNITPPESLQKAIEAKTQAIQQVQVAENETKVAVAEGERKIAAARADSAALVIAAAGEAEAIRRKQVSLNDTYIDYLKIQKWNGILPTVQAGSNGMMLNLSK